MATYCFDTGDASLHGLEGAVMLFNIKYWIAKNKANKKHFYDGSYWTYNSVSAFKELFPFWSQGQITRVLKKLEAEGAIISGNYNNRMCDRTKWYSVVEKEKKNDGCCPENPDDGQNPQQNTICRNQQMDLSKTTNGFVENDEPIPDVNGRYKQTDKDTPPPPPMGGASAPEGEPSKASPPTAKAVGASKEAFDEFWAAYPKKKSKGQAERSFKKVAVPGSVLLAAIEAQKKGADWLKEGGRFIPHPSTWLNAKGWEDEIEPPPPSGPCTPDSVLNGYGDLL